ncbi:MAG: hypothetical protein IPJ98_31700 [Bryobacterales bacterium]|nr:hypothetical protein [Bryobacterales bacterium]
MSISDFDRASGLNYLATVYNGIDLSLYPLRRARAIIWCFLAVFTRTRACIWRSKWRGGRHAPADCGIVQDRDYFREQVEPHLSETIRHIGALMWRARNRLFAMARALLHLNTIPGGVVCPAIY